METTFPTAAQQVGRTLSTTIIDPLVDAFNNLFDSPFAMSVPKANVVETGNEIQIDLAAPGLQKEDFIIKADGNMLTVSAQKESSKIENDDPKNYRREYNYSSFSRSFVLPDSAQVDQTKATYKDGVLTILVAKTDMPKKESKAITVA
jgi:HSP20 family protein